MDTDFALVLCVLGNLGTPICSSLSTVLVLLTGDDVTLFTSLLESAFTVCPGTLIPEVGESVTVCERLEVTVLDRLLV